MSLPRLGALRHLDESLRDLESASLLRSDAFAPAPPGWVRLCSNDYLGYGDEPIDAVEAVGGAGASRLVFGDHAVHREAEAELASWVGAESALLFSSGYATNVGTISALVGPGDVVISDALNHASIIDGCRLSRGRVIVVPHLDTEAVSRALTASAGATRRWVVTESYFSMDGDIPDLGRLRALCDAHDAALIVDEAHAAGVFGEEGAGLCAEAGIRPDVLVGAFGKALGLQGGFVAGSASLRKWLWNRARSFVFSTGLSPLLAALIVERVRRVRRDDQARVQLAENSAALRAIVRGFGGTITSERGPVLPWIFGPSDVAMARAAALWERGILVQAIRPPTVPAGTARIRLTASAKLREADLSRFADALGCFT